MRAGTRRSRSPARSAPRPRPLAASASRDRCSCRRPAADVDQHEPDDERDRGDDLEIDQRLDGDAADAAASPTLAMPWTTVQKMIGATTMRTSRMKRSPSGFSCAPNPAAREPTRDAEQPCHQHLDGQVGVERLPRPAVGGAAARMALAHGSPPPPWPFVLLGPRSRLRGLPGSLRRRFEHLVDAQVPRQQPLVGAGRERSSSTGVPQPPTAECRPAHAVGRRWRSGRGLLQQGNRRRAPPAASRRVASALTHDHMVDRHEAVLAAYQRRSTAAMASAITGANSSPSGRSLPRIAARISPARNRSGRLRSAGTCSTKAGSAYSSTWAGVAGDPADVLGRQPRNPRPDGRAATGRSSGCRRGRRTPGAGQVPRRHRAMAAVIRSGSRAAAATPPPLAAPRSACHRPWPAAPWRWRAR